MFKTHKNYFICYYNPVLPPWLSTDPLAEKYSNFLSYTYTANLTDPDGRDGILIVFPDYKVDTESPLGKQPIGHVGVLLIDNKTGKPTQASLNRVFVQISKAAGRNGRIQGAYVEGDFYKMNNYAQGKLNESDSNHPDYNKDREPYSFIKNNCGTFSIDVLKQDPEVKKKAPWIFIPSPHNIAEEYRDNFPKVNYNPETKTTTSDIYKKRTDE